MCRVFLGTLFHFQYQNEKACRSEIPFILVLKPGGAIKRTTLYTIKGMVKKSFIFVFRFGLWMVFFHDFPENDPFITGAVRHRVRVGDLYKLILIV